MGKKGEKMLRHVCNKLEVEGWIFRSPFQRGKRKYRIISLICGI